MKIRLATVNDAETISRIYNLEVTESTLTLDLSPRTIDEQRSWIEERSGALAVLVGEDDAGEVIGFASMSYYRERAGYRTSVENSIYVSRQHRGLGVGAALLKEIIAVAETRGFHAMFARIVGPQAASVNLHTRHGFELVGIEREVARKFGQWHDVAIMERLLS